MTATIEVGKKPQKKKFQRAPRDYSQRLRHVVQLAFFSLNVWIGIDFVRFVHYYETAGRVGAPNRPAGIEGWLPIASLMNLKLLVETGSLPSVHSAGLFLLIAFLSISWLLRKAFCSWLCPIGTLSEYLWKIGRDTFRRNWRLPRVFDLSLRSLKYALLGFFLYAIAGMPVAAIRDFLEGPYGLIADVKLLNFFRYLSIGGAITLAVLVVFSVFIQNFWCRYLCPYGALLGLFSLAGPLRIRRSTTLCIDCGKCARDCPSALPVDQLVSIRSAECTGCLECVAVCPAGGALVLSAGKKRVVPAWAVAAGIGVLFFGSYLIAAATGHWHTNLPDRVYMELVPRAREFTHPYR
ncbi:MAG TPA: 4Fe-4S binding protein [Bryobacteraceae bacterium]|nr:4Fe-4S binding protein [Bryobacteraceae bacterium]